MKLIDIMKAYNKAVLRENAKLRSIYNNLIREAEAGVETDECDESAMNGEDFASMLKEDPDGEELEEVDAQSPKSPNQGRLMTAKEFFDGVDADIKKGAKNAGGIAISEEQGEELGEDDNLEEYDDNLEEKGNEEDDDEASGDDDEKDDDDGDDDEEDDGDDDEEDDGDDEKDDDGDDGEAKKDESDLEEQDPEGMSAEDWFKGAVSGKKGKGGK